MAYKSDHSLQRFVYKYDSPQFLTERLHCRWKCTSTGEVFLIKRLAGDKLVKDRYLLNNEIAGLSRAFEHDVPRVVELDKVWRAGNGDAYIALE